MKACKALFVVSLIGIAAVCGLSCRGATDNGPTAVPVAAASAGPREARKTGAFQDKRIDESSGLAVSRRYPDLLWTNNDSGDTARVFLVDPRGKTHAVVNLTGAQAHDWEDVAAAGDGDKAWIYAGDIGDNLLRRANIVIYRFREPKVDAGGAEIQTFEQKAAGLAPTFDVPCEKLTLTYPDGAHNAESLIATPGGDIVILTKTPTGLSQIFKAPRPFVDGATMVLTEIGTHQFPVGAKTDGQATGADLSPDVRHLAVTTYTDVYEWEVPADNPWTTLWQHAPRVTHLPRMDQCEGVCYDISSSKLWFSSEGVYAPIWQLYDGVH